MSVAIPFWHLRSSVLAGDGAQQGALAVAAPSASGSHPGLCPVPPQAVVV